MRCSSLGLGGVCLFLVKGCVLIQGGWYCAHGSAHTHTDIHIHMQYMQKNVRKSSHVFVPWIMQDWGMLIFCIFWSLINVLASNSLSYIVTSKFVQQNFNICLLIKRICLHLRKSACRVPQARVFVHVAVESLFIWGSVTFFSFFLPLIYCMLFSCVIYH